MINRAIAPYIQEAVAQHVVTAVVGPRHAGKTTLLRHMFPDYRYINLESLDERKRAKEDPNSFFAGADHAIIDEIHYVPELVGYIRLLVDQAARSSRFIIISSQNILTQKSFIELLGGIAAFFTLLPLSLAELGQQNLLHKNLDQALFSGAFPSVYQGSAADQLYENYLATYLERDVRAVKNISRMEQFNYFIRLCAGRTGQLLNVTALSNDCGIEQKTAITWLSILQATHMIFLLQPYHTHFGKRLVKTPKLYFYDTGVACSLLSIKNADALREHHMRGALLESHIIADLAKQYYNQGKVPSLYFWRDQTGNEIDCIAEEKLLAMPLEIKAGATVNSDFFKQFVHWKDVAAKSRKKAQPVVVYGGDTSHSEWGAADVVSWTDAGYLIKKIV